MDPSPSSVQSEIQEDEGMPEDHMMHTIKLNEGAYLEPGKILLNWVMCSAQGVGLFISQKYPRLKATLMGSCKGQKTTCTKETNIFSQFFIVYIIYIYM